MMKVSPLILFILAGVSTVAFQCNNDFDPKSPDFKERIVVFAVLDASKHTQMVRLAKSYDSRTSNPKDFFGSKEITDARIIMTNRKYTYTFNDTMITDSEGKQRKVWVKSGLEMPEAEPFTLHVEATGLDPVSSNVSIPNRMFLYASVFNSPSTNVRQVEVGSPTGVEAPAKGYLFKLILRGSKITGGNKVTIDKEVPLTVRMENGQQISLYPKLGRENVIFFEVSMVIAVREELSKTWLAENIEAFVIGYALDSNLYNYYYTARGFDDPLTVRQDLPDFTNINGGLGVFGSMTADTVGVNLTELIGPQ